MVTPDSETLWIEHDTKMKKYVVPQTWCFDKSGNLKPFEYLATDLPMQNPPESFAADMYSELKKLGLERNLGIRRIVNVKGRSSWETTPDLTRSNVVVFGKQPEDVDEKTSVVVLWYFDKNGKFHQGAWCGFCNYCNHCTTCTH